MSRSRTRTLTIEKVQARFANWRGKRRARTAIPDELWSAASELARTVGLLPLPGFAQLRRQSAPAGVRVVGDQLADKRDVLSMIWSSSSRFTSIRRRDERAHAKPRGKSETQNRSACHGRLRQPGAPIDNNIVERALKKAILNRKNALFYKSLNGAGVGDLFMSLIHTGELNGAKPLDYLTELQRHSTELAACPSEWTPWNYRQTLARHTTSAPA
jgi:hypothetical protein